MKLLNIMRHNNKLFEEGEFEDMSTADAIEAKLKQMDSIIEVENTRLKNFDLAAKMNRKTWNDMRRDIRKKLTALEEKRYWLRRMDSLSGLAYTDEETD